MAWHLSSGQSRSRVLGAAVREILAITRARFGPESDFTSIARVIEKWAGVEIRG